MFLSQASTFGMTGRLIIALLGIITACEAGKAPAPEPGRAEQTKVLADATRYVLNHQLPDFTCLQTTSRLKNRDETGWSPVDTVVERLTYFDHRESYQLLEINGQPPSIAHEHLQGARLSEELGSMMRALFLPRTKAEFAWQSWVTLRGKRMHAYAYHVHAFRSQYHFELPEESLDIATAYHGTVLIDESNHFVHRITLSADDIPSSLSMRDVSFTLDYDYARVGNADYMLPLRFELSLRDRRGLNRHVVNYDSYRKIDAVSLNGPERLSGQR